jgi:hypothetical protein
VIALPPLLPGAVKVTVALALPAVAMPMVGAPGTVAVPEGVTLLDRADAGPVPIALVAVTVKVYAVPLVKPVTVIGLTVPVAVSPPGLEVAVYPVIDPPPLLDGAVNAKVACALPAVAVPMVGAPGTVAGVTRLDAADGGPVPTELVAVTVKE